MPAGRISRGNVIENITSFATCNASFLKRLGNNRLSLSALDVVILVTQPRFRSSALRFHVSQVEAVILEAFAKLVPERFAADA